jgi:putative transposase
MTPEERLTALESRKTKIHPWHSPPHRYVPGTHSFLLSAACFEHQPIIAHSAERLDAFAEQLLTTCTPLAVKIFAWCVLPNHYHIALQAENLRPLMAKIAQLHGRTSRFWNLDESAQGRQVWFNCVDREMRSHRHLMATINYVHHNPVRHGYVERWQDWPWSSASRFLAEVGRDAAAQMWRKYPIKDYGTGWDD